MSVDTFPDKHPDANRPYTLEWGDDLGDAEKVVSSVWTITGPDDALVKTNPAISQDGKNTVVWLSDGTIGAQYVIENVVETDSTPPRTLVSSKYLNVRLNPTVVN